MITSPKQVRNATIGFTPFSFSAFFTLAWSMGGCAARVKNVTDLPAGVTQKQAQDWTRPLRIFTNSRL